VTFFVLLLGTYVCCEPFLLVPQKTGNQPAVPFEDFVVVTCTLDPVFYLPIQIPAPCIPHHRRPALSYILWICQKSIVHLHPCGPMAARLSLHPSGFEVGSRNRVWLKEASAHWSLSSAACVGVELLLHLPSSVDVPPARSRHAIF
jgi:hypothetical protein